MGERHPGAAPADETVGTERELAARWLAYLVAAAGGLALFNAFVPGVQGYDVPGLVGIAVAAFSAAVVLLRSRGRVPVAALHALVLGGTAGIGAGIQFTDGVPNAASLLYLWVALYAFYFFTRRAAVWQLVAIGASYAVPIVLRPPPFDPVAHWATTIVTISLAGWFVGVLKKRLDETLGRLELLAETDALTGLANRRGWSTRAHAEINRATRSGEPLAVALLDLDDFKAFNDASGHAAGDRLLTDCARAWREALRPTDFVARLGGDEFAVLLPGCDAPSALVVAGRLEAALPPAVRSSIGVAQWHPGQSIRDTVAAADAALYGAKRGSGRRVVLAAGDAPTVDGLTPGPGGVTIFGDA
jgi:diguanylate cyclase (GGDEF)-like protein